MNLKSKKRLAADVAGVGLYRVWFDPSKSEDIKSAITREDLRKLMGDGAILIRQKKGISRGRFREKLLQKRKGRRKGPSTKKGKHTARAGKKEVWMIRIRSQRELLKELLDKKLITNKSYRDLRQKAKGGFFRSVRHIKLYLTENSLWVTKK